MIFVTLGSQKFQFNRLLETIDKLVKEKVIEEKVFAQIGYSDYIPQNYEYKQFIDREEYLLKEEEADIIITHGGTGAIINAVKKGKKVIAVPRLAKYGEHVDDHQLQLIKEFANQNIIWGLEDCSELENAVRDINKSTFSPYISNTDKYIESIENFVRENVRKSKKDRK